MDKPRYETVEALIADCRPVVECMTATFDRVWQADDGSYHAECCGAEVRYKTGIFGPDYAECKTCGSRMLNVLSPHVSPILLSTEGSATSFPSESFVKEMESRPWIGARLKADLVERDRVGGG